MRFDIVEGTGVRDCALTVSGHDYVGRAAVTVTGRTCQAWSSQHPHQHLYTDDGLYPDGTVTEAGNYCRNPHPHGFIGLWCYTTDPKQRWERCGVPLCGTSVRELLRSLESSS